VRRPAGGDSWLSLPLVCVSIRAVAGRWLRAVTPGVWPYARCQFIVVAPCDTDNRPNYYHCNQSNANSVFYNSLASGLNGTTFSGPPGHCDLTNCSFRVWKAMLSNVSDLQLENPQRYDFRPSATSPLRHTGMPPQQIAARAPDVGAYQFSDAEPWDAGCTFDPACGPSFSRARLRSSSGEEER
jgi:hypothetical protein